jgi:hypothetical protein
MTLLVTTLLTMIMTLNTCDITYNDITFDIDKCITTYMFFYLLFAFNVFIFFHSAKIIHYFKNKEF